MSDADIANILGTIGTVLWCIQLSPQIYFLWKKKDATGFPPIFMFLWAASGIPFSIYFVGSDSYIPMQVQPQMFTLLCSIAWIQSMYYPPYSYPKRKCIGYAVAFYAISLACELGFGITLKKVYLNGTHWPMLVFGIIASILLVAGLVPPYFELAKRQGQVVGINFFFLAMDSSGAIFSMASNCVDKIDIMAMILYILVIVMEAGIFTSQLVWWLRIGRKQKNNIDSGDRDNENDCLQGVDLNSIDLESQRSLPESQVQQDRERQVNLKKEETLTHQSKCNSSD